MKIIKWAADKILWTLFVAPALSTWLKDREWASSASGLFDYIYNFTVDLLGLAAFPWVSGALLGAAIGVFFYKLLLWARHALSKTEKQFQRFEALSTDVLILIDKFSGLSSAREGREELLARVQRFLSELHKCQVAIPDFSKPAPTDGTNEIQSYTYYIRPFFADRDMNILRLRAKEWVGRQK